MSEVTRREELLATIKGHDGTDDFPPDIAAGKEEPKVYHPAIPDGKGTALEGSPYRYFVHSLFISGWSPIPIARALKREEGVDLTPDEITAYCLTISPKDVSPGALARFFKNQNYITDPVADQHKLVLLQQERVMRLIRLEDLAYAEDPKKVINAKLTYQLSLLQRWQRELIRTEERLGINRTGPVRDTTTSRLSQPKTLQDLVEESKKVTLIERTVSFEKDDE